MGAALALSPRLRAPPRREPRAEPPSSEPLADPQGEPSEADAAGMPRYLGAAPDLMSPAGPLESVLEDSPPLRQSIAARRDAASELPDGADAIASLAPQPMDEEPAPAEPVVDPSRVRARSVDGGGGDEEGGTDEAAPSGEAPLPEGAADGGSDAGAGGDAGAGAGAGGAGGEGAEGGTSGIGSGARSAEGAAGGGGDAPGADAMAALATGDIAMIDTELAEHQRWGSASAHVGAAGSTTRADFIVAAAGAGALGAFGHGALMGAAMGAGTQAVELGVGRLVARLAGPALARSFPLPAIGAVIGGVFSAYDLATRDWGRTGDTIGRFGEGGSIYEQLANSIAAVSEIIGIATAVLNVIAGVIGAISIAMWIITVLTVGVASPLAATLSTIAGAIGIGTMILDGINALVLQRLVTLFRALHTFTSQADPSDVEAQGGRIGEAAGASAGFVGGMAGGLAGAGLTGAAGRRMGLGHEPPPRVPDAEPPRVGTGDGPTITADPPPVEAGLAAGDRPAIVPPEPVAPRAMADSAGPVAELPGSTLAAPEVVDPHAATMPAPEPVDPHGPTMPAPEPVDPHGPTMPAPEIVDPRAPTALPEGGGMPEIPGPPRLPNIEPLPDYGIELPDWNPAEPSPYAPTERPPPIDPLAPTVPVPEGVDPHASTMPAPTPETGPLDLRPIEDSQAAGPSTPEPAADPASFASLDPTVAELAASPFGDRLAADVMTPMQDVPRDATSSAASVRAEAYAGIQSERPVGWDPAAGLQDQHWFKVNDATVNAAPGTLPASAEAINANRSPLQSRRAGEATLLLTTEGVPDAQLANPAQRGTDYFVDDTGAGRVGEPRRDRGAQTSLPFDAPEAPFDPRYGTEHKFADRSRIPDIQRQIAESRARAGLPPLDEVQLARAAGEQARYVMEGVPATDLQGRPTQPWSGRVVEPSRTPVQMLLAPEVISPDLHAQGRTVDVPPRAARPEPPGQLPLDFSRQPPDPNQLSLPLDQPVRPMAEPRPARASTRSTQPLTPAEFDAHVQTLLEMGVPREKIAMARPGEGTHYNPNNDTVYIGANVNPLPPSQRPTGLANPANAAVEARGVLGHEAIGHREAQLANQVRHAVWLEEFQASTRAALLDPNLSPQQRQLLMQDAAARMRHAPNGDTVYVWTDPLNAPEAPGGSGAARPDGQFRPQDQLPSVIVNPDAAGPRPFAEPAPAPAGGPAAGPRSVTPLPHAGAPEGTAARGAEPIVEPVNPAYPPPPGTGSRQELVDMQNRLLAILQARAQAEALQNAMAADAGHHEANSTPLADLNSRTGEALTAAQAHQQATAQRTAANQQQQTEEGNVGSTLSDYGNRAAGLAMITGPLEGFTTFTSLAHLLPDDPQVLVGAKRGILKMNADGQRFLEALHGVDGAVAGQQSATPARESGIEANAGRLESTAEGNAAAQGELGVAQSGGEALASRNDARAADSRRREGQAAQTGVQLDGQAEDTRTGIADLSTQWQSWAQAHQQARATAIAQTRAAMVARGWRPRETSPGVAT